MKTRTKIIGGLILIGAILLLIFPPLRYLNNTKPQVSKERAAPSPVPMAAPQDRFAGVDRILEGLELGNIAFNSPQSMNLYDTANIQLVLGLETSIDELKEMIEAEGEKEGARIRISDRMEARLSGPGFAITAITPESQAVSRIEVTKWKWEIKPTSLGSHNLHLTLSAILDINGTDTPRAIRTFDRNIKVAVTWQQRMGLFFKENWQWLWAVLLVPIASWLWKRIKRTKANIT